MSFHMMPNESPHRSHVPKTPNLFRKFPKHKINFHCMQGVPIQQNIPLVETKIEVENERHDQ